jgi:hypothetical protein
MTTFQRPVNNFSTTLSGTHTNASGTLALQSGDGAAIGALGSGEVYRVTVIDNPGASETILAIFEATGKSSDTLTGVTAVEGYSDSTIASGKTVQVRPTAKTFTDIHTAIKNLETITEVSVTAGGTLSSTAFGKQHVCSGTSADYTLVLPTAVGNDGKIIAFRMANALTKLVTLDGNSTEDIDGAQTRVMWAGEVAVLMSTGSGWTKIGGRTIPMSVSLYRAGSNFSSAANNTWTRVPMDNLVSGATFMYDSGNSRASIKRSGTYLVGTFAYVVSIGTPTTVLCGPAVNTTNDGSFGYGGSDASSFGRFIGPLALTAGDYVDCAVFQGSGSSKSVYGSAAPAKLEVYEQPSW